MSSTSTVVGGWAVAVSRALNAMGYDGDELLKNAGIDLSQKFVQDARFSSEQTKRFWALAIEKTGFDDIGLRVANFVCPTTFHALGFSLWASATLYDVLNRMVRFDVLLNDGCKLSLREEGRQCRFGMDVRRRDDEALVSPAGVDYFLGAVVKLLKDIKRPDFMPHRVELQRPEPGNAIPWTQHFSCPIEFGSETNSLLLDKPELLELLPTGNPELARQNDRLVAEYLARHDFEDLAARVESKINELMPCGITGMDEIAEALQMNARSMKYRLQQEGTSFKEILDNTRNRLAVRYLKFSNKSFSEIAYSLGFSDPSHFNRAFKRWTGSTPGNYRQSDRLS